MTTGRILLLLAALAVALVQARASPLDAESCTKLLTEHGELEVAGVEADMAKGPEWAKANLGLEKLERVRRFIEVKEQLVFRCRQKSLVSLPLENEDAKEQDKDDPPAPRVPPSGASDKGKSDKGKSDKGKSDKGKSGPAATKKSTQPAKSTPAAKKEKSTQPAKKAAVQPAPKSTPKQQPKQAPGAAKPPANAKAPAKQPAATKGERVPSTAAVTRAPKTENDD